MFRQRLSALNCSLRGSLSLPKAEVAKIATHSGGIADGNDLESGLTIAGTPYVIESVRFVEGDENQVTGGGIRKGCLARPSSCVAILFGQGSECQR